MREIEPDNAVVWPSWCYNTGDNHRGLSTPPKDENNLTSNSSSARVRRKRRRTRTGVITDNNRSSMVEGDCSNWISPCVSSAANTSGGSNCISTSPVIKMEVKTERLSPFSATADNNSSGSGSNTPSSSYPGTPPGSTGLIDHIPSPSSSPVTTANIQQCKNMEQPIARNYSDIMRSLAAKYNNSNPNDYFNTTRNTFSGNFADARFTSFKSTSPFMNLLSPLNSDNSSIGLSNSSKDVNDTDIKNVLSVGDTQNNLLSNFALNSINSAGVGMHSVSNLPVFPALVDMSSTQALINMVRTASAHSASQLETYIKSSPKRNIQSTNNPLDLSSNSQPLQPKRQRKSQCDSNDVDNQELCKTMKDLTQIKRSSSVSPSKVRPINTINTHSAVTRVTPCLSHCNSSCTSNDNAENISSWTVDDVYNFVSSIDICAEYAENFKEQSIDGTCLPLLTEDHLRSTIDMKLGPALKLRAILAQRIGQCALCVHCIHCHNIPNSSVTEFNTMSPQINNNATISTNTSNTGHL